MLVTLMTLEKYYFKIQVKWSLKKSFFLIIFQKSSIFAIINLEKHPLENLRFLSWWSIIFFWNLLLRLWLSLKKYSLKIHDFCFVGFLKNFPYNTHIGISNKFLTKFIKIQDNPYKKYSFKIYIHPANNTP